MNTSELVHKLYHTTALNKAQAGEAVKAIVTIISEELEKENGRVNLHNLGVFTSRMLPAAVRRNPRTGEPVQLPERRKVKFRPARPLG